MPEPRDPRESNPYAAPAARARGAERPLLLAVFCLLLGVYRLATFVIGVALHHPAGEVGKRLVTGVLWVVAAIGFLRLRRSGRLAAVGAAVVTVGHNLYAMARHGSWPVDLREAAIVAAFNLPPIVIAWYVLLGPGRAVREGGR